MKQCKVITIYDSAQNSTKKLINSTDFQVTNHIDKAKIINDYLAQGYEVKHMMWQSSSVMIYFEKDV